MSCSGSPLRCWGVCAPDTVAGADPQARIAEVKEQLCRSPSRARSLAGADLGDTLLGTPGASTRPLLP